MFEILGKVREALKGNKVYIIAWATFALAVIENGLGVDIPGVDITLNPFDAFLLAMGASATRGAIASVEHKL